MGSRVADHTDERHLPRREATIEPDGVQMISSQAIVVGSSVIAAVLALRISSLGYLAHRRTSQESFRLLAIGFGFLTVGISIDSLGVWIQEPWLLESVCELLGIGFVTLSLTRSDVRSLQSTYSRIGRRFETWTRKLI